MENLVRGWEDSGARNHIVEKKNFFLFSFFCIKSVSQKEAAKIRPERRTNIVRNLCLLGKIKQFGLKSKKIV